MLLESDDEQGQECIGGPEALPRPGQEMYFEAQYGYTPPGRSFVNTAGYRKMVQRFVRP